MSEEEELFNIDEDMKGSERTLFSSAPEGMRRSDEKCESFYQDEEGKRKACNAPIYYVGTRKIGCGDCLIRFETLVDEVGRPWSLSTNENATVRQMSERYLLSQSGFSEADVWSAVREKYGEKRKKFLVENQEKMVRQQQEESLSRGW